MNFGSFGTSFGSFGSSISDGVYAGSFDGTNDFAEFALGSFNQSSWNVKTTIKVKSLSAIGDVFSQSAGTGTGKGWLRIETNGSCKTFLGGSTVTIASAGSIVVDTKYDLELDYDASSTTFVFKIDGVTQYTNTSFNPVAASGDFNFMIGHNQGAAELRGVAYSMQVTAGSSSTTVSFNKRSGTTLTDSSGNNNNGTLQNITESTFWVRVTGSE
jgi:hypothetical protein|tara:strand:- start:64 stop:705 length:642 start_codon:yes stop_codon:yes gene_type:complete